MKLSHLALAVVFGASIVSVATAQPDHGRQSPQPSHSSPPPNSHASAGFGFGARQPSRAAPQATAPVSRGSFFASSERNQSRPPQTSSPAINRGWSFGSPIQGYDRSSSGVQSRPSDRGRGFGLSSGFKNPTPPAPVRQPSNHDRSNAPYQTSGGSDSNRGSWQDSGSWQRDGSRQHDGSWQQDRSWQHQRNDGGSAHVDRFFGWRGDNDEWREGYYGRSNRDYSFGLYLDTPYLETSVVSPWYYYPTVPGYLPESYVTLGSGINFAWNSGTPYEFGNPELDDALSALQASFLNEDGNAAFQLVSTYQPVQVFNEGHYMYTLSGSEFTQMFEDTVANTQSSSYQITGVRSLGATINVTAVNTFDNGDGGMDTVYQAFRLQPEDGRYVITAFMTSHYPMG